MPALARLAVVAAAFVASVHGAASGNAQLPLTGGKKLVHSQRLQDLVVVANLTSRAEALYDIAKLSESEYHHPTRVIGSKGTIFPSSLLILTTAAENLR